MSYSPVPYPDLYGDSGTTHRLGTDWSLYIQDSGGARTGGPPYCRVTRDVQEAPGLEARPSAPSLTGGSAGRVSEVVGGEKGLGSDPSKIV